MIVPKTYRFISIAIFLIATNLLAIIARGQDCSRNMLTISAQNSYVATPPVSALNLTHGFTVECWARVQSLTGGAALLDKYSYGIILRSDSTVAGSIRHSNQTLLLSPPNDSLGLWHHYAFVFTPGDSLRLYLDSIEVGGEKSPVTSIDSNTDSLRIGMSITGIGFIGSIDELRIWNIPRSLSSIQQTMFKTLGGNDSGLVLYYPFDDAIGSTRIHDFSEHSHDGYFHGANAGLAPSTSPIQTAARGFALATVEQRIIIPTVRCRAAFDTVVHVRNMGTVPILVDTVGFRLGVAFSIVPNDSGFTLPPDSTKIDSLRIHFEPSRGGFFNDSLYIATSSICGGRAVIGLHAGYDSVGLYSSPATLDFGTVTACKAPLTKSLVLTNASVTDSVTILTVAAPTGIQVLTSFPIRLAAHQDTSILVEMLPGARGNFSAALQFDLDKCSDVVSVPVQGTRASAILGIPDTIDMGTTPASLSGYTHDTTLIVTNSGDIANGISAIGASDSIVQILDGRLGIAKAPGDTVQVRLRIHAMGCGTIFSYIKLKSLVCQTDTSTNIILHIVPPMAVIVPNIDMGLSCLPRDTELSISNPNNISIQIDTISFSQNGIFSAGLFFPIVLPPHSTGIVPVEFLPSASGAYVDTAYFTMSPCGTGIAIFRGTMGFAGLTFSSPKLLFGRGCSLDTVTEFDTLFNRSSDTVFLANNAYSGSSRFSIAPFSFPVVLPPGGSQVISITYIPTMGLLDSGTFTFLTGANCEAASFLLRGSREIAQAQWTSSSGVFDTICPGSTLTKSFHLIDKGKDTIDIQNVSVTGNGFSLITAPSKIGDSGTFVVRFSPTAEAGYSGNLIVKEDSCGTFSLPLSGSGGPVPQLVLSDSVLSFDSIQLGGVQTNCVTITNPSCTPLTVRIDSMMLAGTPFRISSYGTAQILRGDTITLCIQFDPLTYGIFSASIPISFDSGSTLLHLQGVGLAPDIRFSTKVLDFGYVLVANSKSLMIYDTNRGNVGDTVLLVHTNAAFSVPNINSVGANAINSFQVSFHPTAIGFQTDTVLSNWSGRNDTILLRGIGVMSGLEASSTLLDFGNVHVGADSILPLYLFATDTFPSIDSIEIAEIAPPDSFSYRSSRTIPCNLTALQNSDTLLVTYFPNTERHDSTLLTIYFGSHSLVIPLLGTGVEAHPVLNPTSIPFGAIWIDTPTYFYPLQIKDTGKYPLFIDSIFSSDPVFAASPIPSSFAIEPNAVWRDTITFTPQFSHYYSGTIRFRTSYHDTVVSVMVTGKGEYPAGAGPNFGFSVASRPQEEPGQIDTIPVSIFGSRLSKLDTSAIVLDISFDPLMVRMLGADAVTVPVNAFVLLNDSTAEISVPAPDTNGGTIARLFTEALLGPHDTSYIHVAQSTPGFTQPESMSDGLFAEVDCGGPVHGVVFSGPYSTSAIVPNPASDNALLQFQLGLDGSVTINIYNAIGQTVKHLTVENLTQGINSISLDVSDLPAGSYVYRLSSLEYRSEGALAIVR